MREKIISIGIIFLLAGGISVQAEQPTRALVIKAGYIVPIASEDITNGMILIQDGKIAQVGRDFAVPEDAELIDIGNGWILPGLIDAHTTLGAASRYGGSNSDETSNPNTAQMRIIDGINPFAKNIIYTRMGGITSVLATPGRRNVIGGQPAVLKLRGKTVDEMAIIPSAGVKFSLGEGPKDTYGKKGRLPSTRMGSAYVIRNALFSAADYQQKWEDYNKKKDKDKTARPPKRDLQLEPLTEVIQGKKTAFIECYRADDIMTALRIIDEFKLKAVLVGCTEGYKIPNEIARRKVPVIVSPFGVGPRRMEAQDIKANNAAVLAQAGNKIIIKADEALGVGSLRELPLHAAMAVKGGLDRAIAMRAITLSAAEVIGAADRIGSIEKGKDADLVIFNGDPLVYSTRITHVLIDGKIVFSLK